jgi:hypothetical protein
MFNALSIIYNFTRNNYEVLCPAKGGLYSTLFTGSLSESLLYIRDNISKDEVDEAQLGLIDFAKRGAMGPRN